MVYNSIIISFLQLMTMADDSDFSRLRRKRRKLGGRDEVVRAEDNERIVGTSVSAAPTYGFLDLIAIVLEHDLPILFPGSERPRNAYALLGAGGSFLVFQEQRTMEELLLRPEQIRSLEDKMVLKRTRQYHDIHYPDLNSSANRYLSIISELQILLDPEVQAHENIIDLHGLTWDFEPEDDGSYSVWPVLGLEAAECSMQSLMDEFNASEAPLSTRLQYCLDVANALSFLHARHVVHCDVKLENVLACVTQRSGSVGKLSDFGSALLGVNEDTLLLKGVAGTQPWNAPESSQVLRGLDIFKVDVYSFGMLLWRFLTRSPTLDSLEGATGEERERHLQSLDELKWSDQLVDVACEETRSVSTESDELNSIHEVLRKTLVCRAESRCTMSDVCSILARVIDSVSTEDSRRSDDDSDSAVESDESPQAILPIPHDPFYTDVSASISFSYDC